MKILVLGHLFPHPADNGAKLRLFNLVRQLAGRHKIAFLVPEQPAPTLEGLRAALGSEVEVATWPWPRRWRSGLAFFSPLPRDVHPAVPGHGPSIALDQWVRDWTPQVLMATDPVLGEFMRPYPRLMRVVDIAAEYVLCSQRAMRVAPAAERPHWWLRELKWAAYMRSLRRCVDAWLVPSTVDRDALVAQLGNNAQVGVVPNGTNLVERPYSPPADALPRLAHTGSMSYTPNRDAVRYFCADIWPRVLRAVPEARLLVTGDPAAAPDEARRAPGVALTGYLPEIQSLLTTCRATVVPLRLGVGTRFKILEALALGTPVVATSRGAEGLALTDGQDILLADEPWLFAERVVQVLNSPELRLRLSVAGRRLVEEHYSWDVIGKQLADVLDELRRRRTADQDNFSSWGANGQHR